MINGDTLSRPGISSQFLARHRIRHVEEYEAEALTGFKVSGIWIPYPGIGSAEMMVNNKPYGRIRLDKPKFAKYLQPRGTGAELYVPGGTPFGRELVVVEGEFKSLALSESGIPSVAIGGIASAMKDGSLLPGLATVIAKYNPSTVLFLGDNDTALIYDFSREACKLARKLPESCTLKLPRIPLSGPGKGIDDCRGKLGADVFLEFWRELTASAVTCSRKRTADALAVELAIRELFAINIHPDRSELIDLLTELASHVDPLQLDILAIAVNKTLELSVTSFRDSARVRAERRQAEQRLKFEEAKLEAREKVNDPRPKIELPGANRLLSEFGVQLAPLIQPYGYFVKDGVLVVPNESGNGLDPVGGRAFRTSIEKHVVPYHVAGEKKGLTIGFDKTLSKEDSESLLVCPQFLGSLPRIRAINNARFPVLRNGGTIQLLSEGYDRETGILTLGNGPVVQDVRLQEAAFALRKLLEEFCFREDDRERSVSVAIAGMLTLFAGHLLKKGAPRPGFLYSANSEGSGKSLLAKLAMIPRLGVAPTGCDPEDEHEIRKSIFASAIAASPVFFLDNVKKHLSSGSLEATMTAAVIKGRVLGQSREIEVENLMTFFVTGNGATISSDMRRRCLIVELFLREARSEDRFIKNPMDDGRILEYRAEILSSLWAITRSWDEAGRPSPKTSHASFPAWANVIGGILEHAGFESPCTKSKAEVSGDRDIEDMEKLVAGMFDQHRGEDLKPGKIYELCRDLGVFSNLVGETDEDMEHWRRMALGRIFTRFDGRLFSTGRSFNVYQGQGKNSRAYYVK